MLEDEHVALSVPHNALPLEVSLDRITNWAYEHQSPLCSWDASHHNRAGGGLSSWLAMPLLPRIQKIRTSNPVDLENPTAGLRMGLGSGDLHIT